VDVDYQKEIFVVMTNISSVVQMIEFKERIAQAEIVNNIPFRLHETSADIEPYSERDGGFGSTGRI